MTSRKVYCGTRVVDVLRWLRPSAELAAGALLPFMVSKADAQFVRDHMEEPFVLWLATDGWSLEIVSVESAGTDGVWVSAKAISRVTERAAAPVPDRSHSGTLMGYPVNQDDQNE